jgi:hypothetical protein
MLLVWGARFVAVLVLAGGLLFLGVFHSALYNRFITFPKEAAAWQALRDLREEVNLDDGYTDYPGVCHSHSNLSHDSNVPFEEVLQALKDSGRQFICMSDHCVGATADFSLQWRGMHDGVLFVPGFEMRDGLMPFGLPSNAVLQCGEPIEKLAQIVKDEGGVVFFAHSEEERMWDLPQLDGMEIYNLHTDFKDEAEKGQNGYIQMAPDMILSLRAYPDQTFRLVFDEQTDILELWDDLNKTRDITGIAGNDCHQNNGITLTYTEADTLILADTSIKEIGEYELNFFTRLLARIAFGPLEPGREVFNFQLDPYERMVRFASTHALMHELTEEALLEALETGRVYVGFDMIADPTGFTFIADNGTERATMGEKMPYDNRVRLRAESPIPCRFTVIHDGETVFTYEGRTLEWAPSAPGKYRVEAHLDILGSWTPWVYTNPLALL